MKGQTIYFRAPEPADVDLLYTWENDTKIWHLSNTVTPYSRQILEEYILNAQQDIYTAKQLRLMIILNKTGEAVGCIDLFDFDPQHLRAGVGILIDDHHRQKGYAAEALTMLIDYSFDILHLHQLYCNVTPANENSLQLFQKHKFSIIGLKKEWLRAKNGWEDEYMLQLLKEERS